jgi:hypothetical protein
LPVRARFLQREVDDVPAIFPLLRFERRPVPPEIGNRSVWKIWLGGGLRELRDRS